MNNTQQSNNVNIANSGMNKLADTAVQLRNSSTSSQYNNPGPSTFLEADASFACGLSSIPNVSTSSSIAEMRGSGVNSNSSVGVSVPRAVSNMSAVAAVSQYGAPSVTSSNINNSPYSNHASGMNGMNVNGGSNSGNTSFAAISNNFPSIDSIPSPTQPSSKRKKTAVAKQHQLPMFLTKTYHMIDRCDGDVALWAEDGESFVVKNVEKFATNVLPQYFKHSNFSSFARQLNFYGFRKLKAEPILTADYDARTASYVRFYHEHFQKGKPELLIHIKRATKSDVQSKDDVDQLRAELHQAIDNMSNMSLEFDRKLTEITFEMNSKIAALHGKIAELQTQTLTQQRVMQHQNHVQMNGSNSTAANVSQQQQQQQQQQAQPQQTQQQQQQFVTQHQQQQQQQQQQLLQVPPQQQQQQLLQVPPHQQQFMQQTQQTQHNNGSNNKMGGLLAAGLLIKSPALPSLPAQHNYPGTQIHGLSSDNMMLPPAQKQSE